MKNSIDQRLERIEILLTNGTIKPLNFRDASQYLGVSSSYLYKLTSRNKIPHSKPTGKLIYFDKKDLDNWTRRNRIHSEQEISQLTSQHSIFISRKNPVKRNRISAGGVI